MHVKNYRRLVFFLFALIFINGTAQNRTSKTYYRELTYNQYLQENWMALINTGNEAINRGVDFYYLRIRMGIAYGMQANYRMAIANYKKALDFVPNDPIAQEYLYYAYLYGGMKKTAYLYSRSLSTDLRKKISAPKPSVISNIYMETGLAFTSNLDKTIDLSDLTDQYFAETFEPQWQSYFNGSILFNISKSIDINLAYTGLSIHSNHTYKIMEDDAVQEDVKITQRDFYTSTQIYNRSGLIFIPFFHYVNTSMKSTFIDYDSTAYDLEEGVDIDFTETLTSLTLNDPLVGLGIYHRNKEFDFAASLSYSRMGANTQQQFSALMSFLPRGNYSIYFTPSVRVLNTSEEFRLIYKMAVGWSPSKTIWTETSFTYGDLRSTHENFGSVVYNLPDKTKYKTDVVIHFAFKNDISLSLRHQFTQKESRLIVNNLVSTTTGGGGAGIGPGVGFTETEWQETTSYFDFVQHFLILGFNWAI